MPLLKITRPSELVWQISFDSAPDNRLTDNMFAELMDALDRVEYEWREQSEHHATIDSPVPHTLMSCSILITRIGKWQGFFDKRRRGGALVLTSEIAKFFSNGLDFENSVKNPRFHQG